jgi:hypothetical protein
MPKKISTNPADVAQRERFIETARALGCDEDEAAFEEKLKRIATTKPKIISVRSKRIRAPDK